MAGSGAREWLRSLCPRKEGEPAAVKQGALMSQEQVLEGLLRQPPVSKLEPPLGVLGVARERRLVRTDDIDGDGTGAARQVVTGLERASLWRRCEVRQASAMTPYGAAKRG